MDSVDKFLERFHENETTTDTFLLSCSYWFAFILFRRFLKEGAKIMYDKSKNHFGTKICGRVYDITGDVTEKYRWIPWEKIDDPLLRERVTKDCIMF